MKEVDTDLGDLKIRGRMDKRCYTWSLALANLILHVWAREIIAFILWGFYLLIEMKWSSIALDFIFLLLRCFHLENQMIN